jgi:hypothetical protein
MYRSSLQQAELALILGQIRTMVRTISDTGGSRTLVEELRRLEQSPNLRGVVAFSLPDHAAPPPCDPSA